MIIAAALIENHAKSLISQHFGRCNWFGIYDTQSRQIKYTENMCRHLNQHAGLLAADLIIKQEVSIVIAGGFGAKVVNAFKKDHVQMIIPQNNQLWSDFIKIVNKIR